MLLDCVAGCRQSLACRCRRMFAAIEAATPEEERMLWTIFVIVLVLWLLGFSLHVAGSLIHLLLVVALVVLVIQLITGRRAI